MENSLPNRNKQSLDDLFKDLSHPNPNINQKACFQLISLWPEASIERLIGNLSHKNIVLRRKSVKALGFFGDRALTSTVRKFLTNDDLVIRTSCLKVLVKIVSIEQYQSFPNCLKEVVYSSLKDDNPQITLSVVSLLRQLGKQGLPELIEASRNKNVLLAKASVTAIGEINDSSSWDCLISLAKDMSVDKLVRESAHYSLDSYSNGT